MSTTARKARKRAGVPYTRKPWWQRGPRRRTLIPHRPTRDVHGYIRFGLYATVYALTASAGFLLGVLIGRA